MLEMQIIIYHTVDGHLHFKQRRCQFNPISAMFAYWLFVKYPNTSPALPFDPIKQAGQEIPLIRRL
jgi:hypothetical protein